MTKECLGCKEILPLESFHKHSNGKQGRVARCRKCAKESAKTHVVKKIPEEHHREVVSLHQSGKTYQEIADIFSVGKTTIEKILRSQGYVTKKMAIKIARESSGPEYEYCYSCQKIKHLSEFHKNKIKQRNANGYCIECRKVRDRERRYGISQRQFDLLFQEQDGRCAICRATPEENWRECLLVDHCHATGKVRGLLCHSCNTMLGLAKDNEDTLRRAINYLRQSIPVHHLPA